MLIIIFLFYRAVDIVMCGTNTNVFCCMRYLIFELFHLLIDIYYLIII